MAWSKGRPTNFFVAKDESFRFGLSFVNFDADFELT